MFVKNNYLTFFGGAMDVTKVLIDGPAFPVGKLNKNGWGIHRDAVDSAIASLKTSVVRICPKINENEHWCDFTGDRKAEIGKIVDAYFSEESDEIRVMVLINDSIAAQKIHDGVWPLTWSVYGEAKLDEYGFAHTYINKSLTFVDQPAWDESRGELVMVASDGAAKLQSFVVLNGEKGNDDVVASDPDAVLKSEIEVDLTTVPTINTTFGNPDDYQERGVNMVDIDNKEKTDDIPVDYEQVIAAERAKIAELEKQVESLRKLTASAIPADKVETLISSRVQEIVASEREAMMKSKAIGEYKSVCAAAGIEFTDADNERFANAKYTASDIQAEIEMIKKFAGLRDVPVGDEPNYTPFVTTNKDEKTAADYQNETNVWTIGHYNKGEWSTELY